MKIERKSYSAMSCSLSLFLVLLLGVGSVLGASFPAKPIRVLVCAPPGGGVDVEARGIVPYVEKNIGVSVAIENVPGANDKIGHLRLWKAKPDGYTIMIHTATMALISEIIRAPEYQIMQLSHIFSWSRTNQVLVVNSEKWKTFNDFVNAARGQVLAAGSSGLGTVSYLSGLILVDKLGIKVKWVNFEASGETLTTLAGNHIDFAVVATTSAFPLVKAGKLRALLVFANSKDIVFPDAPMPKDLGYDFGVLPMIRGAYGPPKMQPAAMDIIEEAFAKAIKEPNYLVWAQNKMMEIVPLRQKEYRTTLEEQLKEIEKYERVLKQP